MSAKKPGLPDGFEFGIERAAVEDRPPANIGDFLDEDDALTGAAVKKQPSRSVSLKEPHKKVAGRIEPKIPSTPEAQPIAEVGSLVVDTPPDAPALAARPATATKPLRRQINLTPDADDVINDLLAVIKRYSNEPHPNASDVLNALVLAAGESIKELQLQTVPRRGKYGEPTVRIYLQQLKTALQDAIVQHEKYKG